MRRLLGAMRQGERPDLVPQPGLGDLGPMLDEVRRVGLPVTLRVEGEPVPLPPTLALSAYRVVQEGLTNALRHAHAHAADVVVRYRPHALEIDVHDDGQGNGPGDDGPGSNGTAGDGHRGLGAGHGLLGVRERVKVYGGQMTAGAVDGGGFLLHTCFPIEPDPR